MNLKRTLILGVLAALVAGCVVVPRPGYYGYDGGGHRHHHHRGRY